MMFPEDGRPRSEITGYSLEGMTPAIRDKAVDAVSLAMTKTSRDKAQELVVILHTATASRAEGEAGLSVKMNVYANALMDLPLDIAIQTVNDLSKSSKWFPTLSEVVDHGKTLMNPREALLVSLRRWKPVTEGEAEVNRLEGVWRALSAEATALSRRVGPGPSTDTGLRGDRIAAWLAADEAALEAKRSWLAARKSLENDLKKSA